MCRPQLLSKLVQIDICTAHIKSTPLPRASERLLSMICDLLIIVFGNKIFEKDLTAILITYGHECS
jgi:hypothetical protein